MKRLLFSVFVTLLILTGCADFKDTPGVSVWSGNLWIIPWATGLGAAASLYKFGAAYLKFKDYNGEKKLNYGWLIFAVILIVATIAIIWKVIADR